MSPRLPRLLHECRNELTNRRDQRIVNSHLTRKPTGNIKIIIFASLLKIYVYANGFKIFVIRNVLIFINRLFQNFLFLYFVKLDEESWRWPVSHDQPNNWRMTRKHIVIIKITIFGEVSSKKSLAIFSFLFTSNFKQFSEKIVIFAMTSLNATCLVSDGSIWRWQAGQRIVITDIWPTENVKKFFSASAKACKIIYVRKFILLFTFNFRDFVYNLVTTIFEFERRNLTLTG